MKKLIASILFTLMAATLCAAPLPDAVQKMQASTDATTAVTAKLNRDIVDIVNKYRLTNGGECALLIMGMATNNIGAIYFIPGPTPVSALQADISASVPLTITNIVAGPDAALYGKSVASAPAAGGRRFLLFGINQTPIGPGAMAVASFDTTAMPAGHGNLLMANFTASDPNGHEVPLCITTGGITK